MEFLDKYFVLFDESRTNKKAREELISIFSDDMSFVLNGHKMNGIIEWNEFLDSIFSNNLDIKHMSEGWIFNENKGYYEIKCAVCGKTKDGKVYTQTGINIAKLDETGKIRYLENIPTEKDLFDKYIDK